MIGVILTILDCKKKKKSLLFILKYRQIYKIVLFSQMHSRINIYFFVNHTIKYNHYCNILIDILSIYSYVILYYII